MSKLNIGIAGLGNVGSALVETIEENKNYFFDKTNLELNIVGISARTLQRRFADLLEVNKNKGKASLRKRMYEKAMKGNDKLLIWLSKQYLNMSDRIHNTNTTEPLPLIIEAKAEEVKDLNGKKKG